jgi:hypothetical protein
MDFSSYHLYKQHKKLIHAVRRGVNFSVLKMLPENLNLSISKNPTNITTLFPEIINLATKKLSRTEIAWSTIDRYLFKAKDLDTLFKYLPELIRDISQYESLIYYKKQFPLYRGTINAHDWVLTESDLHSISYGNSLFAGIYFDRGPKGACAWFYFILQKTSFSYLLPLLKADIIKQDSIYYTSTIPLLLSHLTSGEFFHSRVKISFFALDKNSKNKKTFFPKDDYPWEKIKGVFHLKTYASFAIPSQITNLSINTLNLKFSKNYSKAYFLKANLTSNNRSNPVFKDPDSLKQIKKELK